MAGHTDVSPLGLLLVLSLCSYSGRAAALPVPKLKLSMDTVYTGEKVTLTCDIQPSSDWRYVWTLNNRKLPEESDTNTYTIDIATVSDQGHYKCYGRRMSSKRQTGYSNTAYLTVKAPPTATVVVVRPQSPFYPGERVTLRCDIAEYSDWQYVWYKDSNQISSKKSETIIISFPDGAGQYTCEGHRRDRQMNSQCSGPVTISVSALPTATLSVQPDSPVFTGEAVTLQCVIEREDIWRYKWYKERNSNPVFQTDTSTHTITAAESHKGQYWCRGERRDRPTLTQPSRRITLDVRALPTATVSVEPPQGPYYPGDEITLSCNIAEHTGWYHYYWYRDSNDIYEHSRTINTALPDQTGQHQYTCEGGRSSRPQKSQRSAPRSVMVTALPVPTLKLSMDTLYTGEKVTLTCGMHPSNGWRYEWTLNNRKLPEESETNTYTIDSAIVSDQGQYKCYGRRTSSKRQTGYSNTAYLTVKALPTATLTVVPQSPVFTGETVTMTCVIESLSGWTYQWYKGSNRVPVSEGNTFTFTSTAESDEGQYWCQGERRDSPTTSQHSSSVTLHVTGSKPILVSNQKTQLLTGDSVTLKCELGVRSGLVFYWYRDTQTSDPVAQTDGDSYSIRSVRVSDGGQYWCRAGRGDPVYYTQYSNQMLLMVTEYLSIRPQRAHHFTKEPLSLTCGAEGNSTGWRLRWFTGRGGGAECPTDWRSETASTCSTSSASLSVSGVYWCQSESGEQSNPVNITVHDGDVILDSPVRPVIEGRRLSLLCMYRNTSSVNITYFYRDGSLLHTSSTGAMTIPAVSKSHEGLYKCGNPEKGESPGSWITVRGVPAVTAVDETEEEKKEQSSGSFILLAVGVVVGVLFLAFLIFWLHSRYLTGVCLRTSATDHQPQQQSTNQSSVQSQGTNQSLVQSTNQSSGSDSVYMPLQTRNADIYDTITPLYMPLQRGAADVYETIKPSEDPQEDNEEDYDDVTSSD